MTMAQVALKSDAELQLWWVQSLASVQHDALHHICRLKVQGLVEGRWQWGQHESCLLLNRNTHTHRAASDTNSDLYCFVCLQLSSVCLKQTV